MKRWHRVALCVSFLAAYLSIPSLSMPWVRSPVLATLCADGAAVVLGLVHGRLFGPRRPPARSRAPGPMPLALLPVVWFITSLAATCIAMWFSSPAPPSSAASGDEGWYLLLVALAAPVAEEAVFRGVLFRHLRDGFPAWIGYMLSSLLFALIHNTPAQIITASLCGLYFAAVYDYYGRLWYSIAAHVGYNLMTLLLCNLPIPALLLRPFVTATLVVLLVAGLVRGIRRIVGTGGGQSE